MRRASFTQSLFGMVSLLSLVGCGDLKEVLDGVRDLRDGKTPPVGGGVSGSCSTTTEPNGGLCKTCFDATGKVVTQTCEYSGGTGTGGSGGMSGGTAPAACITLEQGGPTSCKDVGTWKQYAYEDCTQRGLTFTDYKPQIECGSGSYQSVSYVCCPPPPPPPPIKCGESTDASGRPCKTCWDQNGTVVRSDCGSTGAGGAAGGGTCIRIVDGGETSCKDIGTWKMYGAQRCAEQNLTLNDLLPVTMCEGGIQSVAYVCCGQAPPPPPPTKCEKTTGANGEVCEICYDANGKIVSQRCSGGGTGGSTGGMCFRITDGGPGSCKDAGVWNMYGIEQCAAQKATLTQLTPGTKCDAGLESVVYTCCVGATPVEPSPAKCQTSKNADGSICTTCWDGYGKVVTDDCKRSVLTCNSYTNEAGANCTDCTQDGKLVSSKCDSTTPPVGMCTVEKDATGAECKVCYYDNGLKTSSCPTPTEPK